jgi:hypothetical protein
MKTNSHKTNRTIWFCALIGPALMLLPICQQRVVAQSNTFPSSGNVGIGTSSPGGKLEVQSDVDNGIGSPLRLTNMGANAVGGAGTSISFNHKREDGSAENTARIVATSVADGTNVRSGKLQFIVRTGPDGSDVNAMMINANGSVGIGTTSPTTKLHVVGDLTVTGNIAAKYQDVAEWVESSQALPLGTVVVLDSTKSNQVISSTQAYDSRVAGVISERPGIALGENGAGKVLVATTGRLRVKVDATHSAIQVGDLLVTSDKEGLAMKSQPINIGGVQIHRPGTLIGKALEPLAKGAGEILVLLSLQ